jgi:hypothetical protein
MTEATPPEESPPLLRIVKGDPTPEEVAALVTVVSAMAAGAAEAAAKDKAPKPEWSANRRKLRTTYRHGHGAWRASSR